MNNYLLSIVIPTKNRYDCLKSFINLFEEFDCERIELVIQDNSDIKTDIEDVIKKMNHPNIKYNYENRNMPVIENSELAILNSTGKYVCFMGDDDLLSKYILNVVEYMDRNDIDVATFKKATYVWPGTQYLMHKFSNLTIPNFTGNIVYKDIKKEYRNLLLSGGTELNDIPQLYHGIVKRSILDNVKVNAGTFFPGPSPDMAIAACLPYYATSHIYIDAPYISSGKSASSTAGLVAKHMHKGKLADQSFLPKDIEAKWDERLPKVWTVPTIYAESVIEALKALGKSQEIQKLNFAAFFANFDSFHPEYRVISTVAKKNVRYSIVMYYIYRVRILFIRLRVFLYNKLFKNISGVIIDGGLDNTVEAEKIIDECLIKISKL